MINSLAVRGNASVDISSLIVLEISLWSNERVVFLLEFLIAVGVVKLFIRLFDV